MREDLDNRKMKTREVLCGGVSASCESLLVKTALHFQERTVREKGNLCLCLPQIEVT